MQIFRSLYSHDTLREINNIRRRDAARLHAIIVDHVTLSLSYPRHFMRINNIRRRDAALPRLTAYAT